MLVRETLEELYSNQRLSQRAIARKLGIGHTTVRRYLKKYGISTLERDVFEWNEDAAYILGALLGDGCAYTSYSNTSPLIYRTDLAVSDKGFAKRVFDAALRIGLRPHWYKSQTLTNSIKTYTRYKVGFLSNKLYQMVRDLRAEPYGLLALIEDIKQASFLLTGFYDAEGCHCTKNTRWHRLEMSNTNMPLLSVMSLMLKKIDLDFRIRLAKKEREKRKAIYRLVSTRNADINSFLETVSNVRRCSIE